MSWSDLVEHRWYKGVVVTESVEVETGTRYRYTAVICGFPDWHIYEGRITPGITLLAKKFVRIVRDQLLEHGKKARALHTLYRYSRSVAELRERIAKLQGGDK